jgi:hypothetical protein
MPPRKKVKVAYDPTLTPDQVQSHIQLITEAAEAKDYNQLRTCVQKAYSEGMPPTVTFPTADTELPLPAYLASAKRIPLLRQLLDDDVISLSASNVSADDMWEHINVTKADIPHACAIMEKFGNQLRGPCSINLVQWINVHPFLADPLTQALFTVPCPYPHLARAVVEVTPINSQAVTIAAKHDRFDWLRKNAARLTTIRPEGYTDWEALRDHLVSQGGLTVRVQTMLQALAAGSEGAYHVTTVGKRFWDVLKKVYLTPTHLVSVADTCAALDCIGSELQNHKDELKKWLSQVSEKHESELVSELCRGTYPHLAYAVAPCIAEYSTVASEAQFVNFAVRYGFVDILKKRVQKENGSFNTPLYKPTSSHSLACYDHINAWLWLIKGDGDLTENMWHIIEELGLALCGGYHQFFLGLSLSGAKITGRFISSSVVRVLVSGCDKDIDVLKYLVESGVDIVSLCPTALYYAHDLDTMKYLAQCGATPCAAERGSTPLHKARQPAVVVDFLIEIGADVNAVDNAGKTPLHYVYTFDVAKSLIAHKADVNSRDNDGKTPLHSNSRDDIVQLLIDHKADVHALDNASRTPLHYRKSRDAIKTLLKNGADIEALDEHGMTPFMTAVGNDLEYPLILLQNGANPNAVDPKGRTAIHYITSDSADNLYDMIKMKADPNIRDNDGNTPLDLATDWNVITQLRRVGDKRSSN